MRSHPESSWRDGWAGALVALAVFLMTVPSGAGAADELQALRLPAPEAQTAVLEVRFDGRAHSLHLRQQSFRSFDFQLLEDRGGQLYPVEVSEARTYVGEIDGTPGSHVGAIFSDEGMTAFIHEPGGEVWVIEPETDTLHRSYRWSAKASSPGSCGVVDSSEGDAERFRVPQGASSDPDHGLRAVDDPIRRAAKASQSAEIAFDADYELYEINGYSSWAVLQDIETILLGVNVIYESQFPLTHTVSAIIVRTTSDDPYSYTDPEWLLEQMADHWNTSHSGIRADLVHLMTGRDILWDTVGIAYVGAVCVDRYRYGLSQTHYDTDLGNRVALTAHEIGHNWSARHCDGDADCNIMCTAIGACNPVIDVFGSAAVDSISSFVDIASCLEPAFPQVVYVDGSYTGASSGTFSHPFTSVGNGVSGLVSGGLLVIRSGAYNESLMLQRPMLFRTYQGTSVIAP